MSAPCENGRRMAFEDMGRCEIGGDCDLYLRLRYVNVILIVCGVPCYELYEHETKSRTLCFASRSDRINDPTNVRVLHWLATVLRNHRCVRAVKVADSMIDSEIADVIFHEMWWIQEAVLKCNISRHCAWRAPYLEKLHTDISVYPMSHAVILQVSSDLRCNSCSLSIEGGNNLRGAAASKIVFTMFTGAAVTPGLFADGNVQDLEIRIVTNAASSMTYFGEMQDWALVLPTLKTLTWVLHDFTNYDKLMALLIACRNVPNVRLKFKYNSLFWDNVLHPADEGVEQELRELDEVALQFTFTVLRTLPNVTEVHVQFPKISQLDRLGVQFCNQDPDRSPALLSSYASESLEELSLHVWGRYFSRLYVKYRVSERLCVAHLTTKLRFPTGTSQEEQQEEYEEETERNNEVSASAANPVQRPRTMGEREQEEWRYVSREFPVKGIKHLEIGSKYYTRPLAADDDALLSMVLRCVSDPDSALESLSFDDDLFAPALLTALSSSRCCASLRKLKHLCAAVKGEHCSQLADMIRNNKYIEILKLRMINHVDVLASALYESNFVMQRIHYDSTPHLLVYGQSHDWAERRKEINTLENAAITIAAALLRNRSLFNRIEDSASALAQRREPGMECLPHAPPEDAVLEAAAKIPRYRVFRRLFALRTGEKKRQLESALRIIYNHLDRNFLRIRGVVRSEEMPHEHVWARVCSYLTWQDVTTHPDIYSTVGVIEV